MLVSFHLAIALAIGLLAAPANSAVIKNDTSESLPTEVASIVESVLADFHFSVVSIRSGIRIEGTVDGRVLKLWIYRFPKSGDRVIIESAVWKGDKND